MFKNTEVLESREFKQLEEFCYTLFVFTIEIRKQTAAIKAYENVFGNKNSPNIFLDISNDSTWRELLVELAKLFDPSGDGDNKNWSLHRLQEMLFDESYQKLFLPGESILLAISMNTLFELYSTIPIKKARNKQLSHHDVKQLSKKQRIEIPFKSVEELVLKTSVLIEMVYSHLTMTELSYVSYEELVNQCEKTIKKLSEEE